MLLDAVIGITGKYSVLMKKPLSLFRCVAFLLCSEKITIYYYKSNGIRWGSTGMPVVLNLTDSNCFLKCCKQADRIILKLEVIKVCSWCLAELWDWLTIR